MVLRLGPPPDPFGERQNAYMYIPYMGLFVESTNVLELVVDADSYVNDSSDIPRGDNW